MPAITLDASALLAAGPDRLRRTATLFDSVSETLIAGIIIWGLFTLLALLPVEADTWIIACAFLASVIFLVFGTIGLGIRLSFSRQFDPLDTINDFRWRSLVTSFEARSRRLFYGGFIALIGWPIPIILLLTLAWHIHLGRVTNLISIVSEDKILQRLCAESRRTAWALLLEILGLPLIFFVLHHSGLLARFGGWIIVSLMGFIAYALVIQYRACRRASRVLNQLATQAGL